jgi:hypothetical protein
MTGPVVNEPLRRFCDKCRVFTEWPKVNGRYICSACDRPVTVQRDVALIEYQQQLWASLRQVKNREHRRSLLQELERTNTGGRAALYDMVEGCDSWPPPARCD